MTINKKREVFDIL